MSAARRERLRQAIIQRGGAGVIRRGPQQFLTPERLQELAAIDHVESVIPSFQLDGRVRFRDNFSNVRTLSPIDERTYRQRLVAGSFFTAEQPRGILVNEFLLYGLGVVDEVDVERALGNEMVLEYSSRRGEHWSVLHLLGASGAKMGPEEEDVLAKIAQQLPAAIDRLELTAEDKARLRKVAGPSPAPRKHPSFEIREAFTLVGVFRDETAEETRGPLGLWRDRLGGGPDIVVPTETMRQMYFRVPGNRENGVNSVTILVDSEDYVEAVEKRIRGFGFETFSLASLLREIRLNVLLVTFSTTFVALVALLVAGLGITNTLLMSVLERTHEIGVMKAVGAHDRHIQLLFLLEGAWIGLLGSALGLLCGWLASLPGDRIARRLAEQQTQTQLDHSLFVFPWWLVLGVPLFVTLLTMLAAVYPVRRAARVNPMTALRHE